MVTLFSAWQQFRILTFIWKIGSWWSDWSTSCKCPRLNEWMNLSCKLKDLHHPFFIYQVTHSKLELTSFILKGLQGQLTHTKKACICYFRTKSLSMPTEKSLFRFQLNLTRLKKFQNCFQRGKIYTGWQCPHICFGCVNILSGKNNYSPFSRLIIYQSFCPKSEMSFITRKDLLLLNSKYRGQGFHISLWKQNCKWDTPHVTLHHSCRYSLTLSLFTPSLSNP